MPTYLSAITFAQLQAEYGGAATNIALGNYYSGGVNVPANTIGYPTGGGPTGAGFVTIPASGALALKGFFASAKLTTAAFDLQFGAQTNNTVVTGTWTVPRLIVGDITITVIGGGGAGAGGPSSASGGGGGGGAIRVIPGSALLSLINPGSTIAYSVGNRGYDASGGAPGGSFQNPGESSFGVSGQEWYIVGYRGENANNGYNPGGGPGGSSAGTTPTYGTRTLGSGGHGNSGAATTQGGGGGGANGGGAYGAGAGWGARGGPGKSGGGDVRTNPTYMGVWPGGGGGASDSTGWYIGAFGAAGGVRIQGTWAY
jgi:hypothetical protein